MAKRIIPAGLAKVEQRIKDDIKRVSSMSSNVYAGELQRLKTDLRNVQRRWRVFKDHPVVQQMSTVVEELVTSYQVDFYLYDLEIIEKHLERGSTFAWFVRDMGTHMVWLDGTKEEVQRGQNALRALQNSFSNHSDIVGAPYSYKPYPLMDSTEEIVVEPIQRLYVCDLKNRRLKPVKRFSDVKFRVTDAEGHMLTEHGAAEYLI